MRQRAILLTVLFASCCPVAAGAAGGRMGGMVTAEGTPQLGATVIVAPEDRPGTPLRLVTDARGVFASAVLLPGLYSVRVRQPGFLPAFEPRVRVTSGQITLLRIELGSVFSSVERLRRGERARGDPDEWNWVLRSATLTRPILRFSSGTVSTPDERGHRNHASHGRAELTAGSLSSWSPADPQPLGSTAFLYDHELGDSGHLLLAGRVGYQDAAASAFAATWVRSTDAVESATDSTTIIFRESQLGPGGPSFRGLEVDSTHTMRLSNGAELDYGGQYVVAAIHSMASAIRPEARLRLSFNSTWTASFVLGSSSQRPTSDAPLDPMDSFATPLRSAGRLALDHPWHEEIGVDHPVSREGTLSAAIFHDADAHTAIFGRGSQVGPNCIADPFSNAFVYDGGSLNQWGARVGYTEKLSSHWQAALLYGWSRTLAHDKADLTGTSLNEMIGPQRRDSLGGRLSGRIERTGTEVSADYQWIDGPILTRPDPFGATVYGIDPYLNLSVRQPLPNFLCCRIVAIVDVRNLLAQGYVSLETGDGRAVLIPTARAIRGGFAVQF